MSSIVLPLAKRIRAVTGPSEVSSCQPGSYRSSAGPVVGDDEKPKPPSTSRFWFLSVRISPSGTWRPRYAPVSNLTPLALRRRLTAVPDRSGIPRICDQLRPGQVASGALPRWTAAFLLTRWTVHSTVARRKLRRARRAAHLEQAETGGLPFDLVIVDLVLLDRSFIALVIDVKAWMAGNLRPM